MQEMNEMQTPCKRPRVLKECVQSAAVALQINENLLALIIAYLFCIVALFSASFFMTALSFFWVSVTFRGMLIHWLVDMALWVVLFAFLLLPLFTGRMRMAGMVAAGRAPEKAELFHYFTSLRLWWRGVRIALLWVIVLLRPSHFAAPGLAMGNEELSLSRALSLSRDRLPGSAVLAFLGRMAVRLLLSVLTLGLLWLLYDAHHSAVTYFALCMREDVEEPWGESPY